MKIAALSLLFLMGGGAFAMAQEAYPAAPIALPAQELDAVRGGFLVAGELAFQFGAVVRTFEDGVLALQTQVEWSEAGPVVTRMTDSALAGLSGAGAQVLQNVQNGQLSNILINTDSNRNFRQETDITLTLPGFAATQADFGAALAAQRLSDDLSLGAVAALR